MPKATPIAVCVADLHLSLTQPVCRADKDWLEVQIRYLDQLNRITGDLPVICAGDIFDRWNAPPELINFALKHLPDDMLCVPGQHDLPNHRTEAMEKSGYGVLKEVGKIIDLSRNGRMVAGSMVIYGAGWNETLKAPIEMEGKLHVAAIHRYCWIDGKQYPGAEDSANLAAYKKELKGYDIAIFGDNHKGFLAESGSCKVINCGGFIRRKSDEIDYQPKVGVLYSDGTIKRQDLDTSEDLFHDQVEDREEVPLNLQEFIKGLEDLGEHGLNFKQAVRNHLRSEDIEQETKEIILTALEASEA